PLFHLSLDAFGTLLRSAFQPLERGDHLLGRAVPLLRIRLHRFPDDLPEGMATRPPSWGAVPRDFSEFDDARQEAGAHVSDAVKVKALVDHARLALRGEAPALDAPDGRSFAGTKLADGVLEIDNLDAGPVKVGDHDVFAVEVSMDVTLGVHVGDPVEDIDGKIDDFPWRERAPVGHQRVRAEAVDGPGEDAAKAADFKKIAQCDDARVAGARMQDLVLPDGLSAGRVLFKHGDLSRVRLLDEKDGSLLSALEPDDVEASDALEHTITSSP